MKNIIGISQFFLKKPKMTKDVIYSQDEMEQIFKKQKAQKIIELKYIELPDGYKCRYKLRNGSFIPREWSIFKERKERE